MSAFVGKADIISESFFECFKTLGYWPLTAPNRCQFWWNASSLQLGMASQFEWNLQVSARNKRVLAKTADYLGAIRVSGEVPLAKFSLESRRCKIMQKLIRAFLDNYGFDRKKNADQKYRYTRTA